MRSLLIIFIAGVVLQTVPAFAQQHRDETMQLERFRKEIAAFKQQLSESALKEKSVLQNLQELDYEIPIREKLLDELKYTEQHLAAQMRKNTATLNNIKNELELLRENFKKRAVTIYKYGSPDVLECLINTWSNNSVNSVNKVLSLQKYFRVLAKHDERAIMNITEKARQVALLNESLTSGLKKQKRFLRDAQKEAQLLHNSKIERQKLLTAIREDKSKVQLALAEREKAERALLDEITNIHDGGTGTSASHVSAGFALFSQMKGRLPWPVAGYVVSHTGLEQDPVTKTKTLNRGVDILSNYGAEIRVVCDGRVAKIKWLPWFGQTIFIQHTEGYYTVYARLSEISVNLNDRVTTNQVIGKVGKEATTSEAKLHFQIWKGSKTLNPENWFRAINTAAAPALAKSKKIKGKS